jgi:esterase/lipase
MKKIAVVLHGWPVPVNQSNKVCDILVVAGYKVVMPEYMKLSGDFSPNKVVEHIVKILEKNKPELVVGVSLGGLLVPYLAKKFPEAKLLIVASGYEFRPKMKWFEKAVKGIAKKGENRTVKILGKMPWWMWSKCYKVLQQVDRNDWKKIRKDVENFGKSIKLIKVQKQVQLAKFLEGCNNAALLRVLKNKTLVIAGQRDKLMPLDQSRMINILIEDCELVECDATHYRVLNEEVIEKIYNFIRL